MNRNKIKLEFKIIYIYIYKLPCHCFLHNPKYLLEEATIKKKYFKVENYFKALK